MLYEQTHEHWLDMLSLLALGIAMLGEWLRRRYVAWRRGREEQSPNGGTKCN